MRSGERAPRASARAKQAKPHLTQPVFPPSALDFAIQSLGFTPDPPQARLLAENPLRCILNCSRQWGKSTVSAVKALHHALTNPESFTAIISPSARQSAELVRKIERLLRKLSIKPRGDGGNEISILLPNQSRIVGLPGKDSTIRGFSSVSLLIVDEAARVPDELYLAVRPMLAAAGNPQLWLISTPSGRSGFFYETYTSPDPAWTRISVPATECRRISPKFLAEERASMSAGFFSQEYLCEFIESEDTLFTTDTLQEVLIPIPGILLGPGKPILHVPLIKDIHARMQLMAMLHQIPQPRAGVYYYIGVDLGQKHDYTAICIIERSLVITGPRDAATFEYPLEKRYIVRYLERLPLDTPYPEIVRHISAITRHPDLCGSANLIIDSTGVGQPVVDLFKAERLITRLVPVTLTAGHHATRHGDAWNIPRNDILLGLEIGLRNNQLRIADTLKDAPCLIEELRNLRRRDEQISPLRGAHHDDLVFATALAYWRATLHDKGT
ncbi:MAG TPA: terminase family protein [Bryobacteraceae bacterium]|nr:terminase family protein [Bryobacteraceae bacterium]